TSHDNSSKRPSLDVSQENVGTGTSHPSPPTLFTLDNNNSADSSGVTDHLNKPSDLLLRSSPPAVTVNQHVEEIKNTIGSPTRPSALPFPSSPLEEKPSQEDDELIDQLLQEPIPNSPLYIKRKFYEMETP
ncbi:unnamed protein product, partial [Lymnaea stagnalis]